VIGAIAERWNTDLVQAAVAVAVRVTAAGASFAVFALAARVTGPAEFGTFSTLFSAAMLAGLLGSFGQQVFLVKEVPRAREAGDAEAEYGAYLFAGLTTLLGATVGAAVVAIAAGLLASPVATPALAAVFALAWLFAASQTTMGALRVQERTLWAMTTRDVGWRALSIVGVAAYAALPAAYANPAASLDAGRVLSIVAFTLVPVVAAQVAAVMQHVRRRFAGVRPRFHGRRWLESSSGMAVIGLVSSADLYGYTLVLGLLTTPAVTGAFFAALKTVELLNLFLMAVTLIVAPELSRLVAREEATQLQRKCNTAILLQGAPALVAGVAMVALASPILALFAPEYAANVGLLRLLVLGMLINALTGATVLMLQLAGLHWLQVWLQGGTLLLALASLFVTIPWFGVEAAGYAFIATKGLWNVAAIVAIRRRLGVDPSALGLLAPGAGGVAGAWRDLRSQVAGRIR